MKVSSLVKALQESTACAGENHDLKTSYSEQLWVEKYAPKSFTELLSNEQTNREVCFHRVIFSHPLM